MFRRIATPVAAPYADASVRRPRFGGDRLSKDGDDTGDKDGVVGVFGIRRRCATALRPPGAMSRHRIDSAARLLSGGAGPLYGDGDTYGGG